MLDKVRKEIHTKYKMWIEKSLTVSAYDLHRSTVFSGKYMKIGFIEWSNYLIYDDKQNSTFSLIRNKLKKPRIWNLER